MADFLQQLRLGGTTYDFYDSEFIIDNRAASGAALTGVSKASELFDGMQITYWLNYDAGEEATLNLTLSTNSTTGAIPIYYSGTTRLGTQYAAGSVLRLVYKTNVTIGETTIAAGWWADANDSDNYLPLAGGTMEGRLNIHGTPINGAFTGTGDAAYDAGDGVTNRYHPAKWTFNTGFTATDGDIFIIKVPVAGHSYGVYISVDNGAHYYPAAIQGTTRLQTSFAVDVYIAVTFESSASVTDMFALNGADARATVTDGAFRVLNYYDSNTNTAQRTYRSTTNVELPVAGISTANSKTAAYSAISSGGYKDLYAAIPNDTAKVVTLNPSTGYLTLKALTASQGVKLDANKRLVSNNLAVTTATDESTEATRFVHSVTEDAVGKITVKTRPMPSYILASEKGANSGVAELDSNGKVPSSQLPASDVLNITATPGENNTFTTTTAYTDFTAALSAGKVIQVSIPTLSANGVLAGKTGSYYTFNMYDESGPIVYIYVFTASNVNNLLVFSLADAQKTIPDGWQMTIPNAGKYVLSSTGTETAWVPYKLVMEGTPLGSLTNDYITTTTSWSEYQQAILNHNQLILEIAAASLSVELLPQEDDGSLVNTIAHVALGSDVYVSLFTFSASNNSGTVQFRYNNQILSYTEKAYNAVNARYTEYFANSEGLSDGNYILNQSNGTSSWSSLPTIPTAPYVGTFNLTTSWSGNGPYTQTVSISGGTVNSKIDLQPNSTVLTQMTTDGVTAMYVENNNGTFTVYALGAAPSAALTIQYTRTEVTTS